MFMSTKQILLIKINPFLLRKYKIARKCGAMMSRGFDYYRLRQKLFQVIYLVLVPKRKRLAYYKIKLDVDNFKICRAGVRFKLDVISV